MERCQMLNFFLLTFFLGHLVLQALVEGLVDVQDVVVLLAALVDAAVHPDLLNQSVNVELLKESILKPNQVSDCH